MENKLTNRYEETECSVEEGSLDTIMYRLRKCVDYAQMIDTNAFDICTRIFGDQPIDSKSDPKLKTISGRIDDINSLLSELDDKLSGIDSRVLRLSSL